MAVAPAFAIVTLVLLGAALVTVRSTSAQSTETPTCSTGAAVPDPDNNPGLVSDCEALLASRDTLAGDATLNWSVDVSFADWDGITVSGTPQRVTELILDTMGLNGEVPSEFGGLAELEVIRLFDNDLTGEIPEELSNLINLQFLDLRGNRLTGAILEELGGLTRLQLLLLGHNELNGQIPAELGELENLQSLVLEGNQLVGEIPASLANLEKLRKLDLEDNKLTG